MPEDGTIAEAVQRVSLLAGREVEVSALADAHTNSVFLVRAGADRYVFRVPGKSSDLLEINRADERYNAEMAAQAGVAPDVVDYVDGLDVMVLQFIDGFVPTVEDLQTPDQVRRIANAVRGLHGGPRFNNDADMLARAKRLGAACDALSIRVPDGVDSRMAELDTIAGALALHPMPTVPCHNDLAAYNFIDDGDRLWIIDFEFSGNNDPCFDLGMIAAETELDDDLRNVLCESYFGEAVPSLLARCELWAVIANAHWSLYCAIQGYGDGSAAYWKDVVNALDSDHLSRLLRLVNA